MNFTPRFLANKLCPQNFPNKQTLPKGSKTRNYAPMNIGAFARIYAPATHSPFYVLQAAIPGSA